MAHELTPGEQYWCDRQPWLLSLGYQVRPRFRPGWVPSWFTHPVKHHGKLFQREDFLRHDGVSQKICCCMTLWPTLAHSRSLRSWMPFGSETICLWWWRRSMQKKSISTTNIMYPNMSRLQTNCWIQETIAYPASKFYKVQETMIM